jgi:hypothetical protein
LSETADLLLRRALGLLKGNSVLLGFLPLTGLGLCDDRLERLVLPVTNFADCPALLKHFDVLIEPLSVPGG